MPHRPEHAARLETRPIATHLPSSPARRTLRPAGIACALAAITVIGVAGCASSSVNYQPGAPLLGETAPDLASDAPETSVPAQPAATFPVRLAIARLSGEQYGQRRRITSASSPSRAEDLKALQRLPEVTDVAVISPLLLQGCESMQQVRDVARELQADILLAWTLDSRTEIDDHDIGPLGLLTLGFAPNQEAISTVTASAVFMDARTGFIYGIAEASAERTKLGNAHNRYDVSRDMEEDAGEAALKALQPELEMTWRTILARFSR